ncbi:hypothetical protein [Marinobacterium jannaschii]|uniref:hypothetical protein n=1 Tax=Marinobacterium jannaschii TaxID=64970 RepID=UPI000687B449|nr:hypothetical protein [Marinobacterium jannaschii]
MRINSYNSFVIAATCLLATPVLADVTTRYQKSIEDAAVIEPEEIVALKTLTGDTAKVVTWTKYPDSYVPGQDTTLSWGETWVTLDGDLQSMCKDYRKKKLNLRIQQLLGLPPEEDAKRFVVVLEASTRDMFRPCANPSLTATSCTAGFPEDASEAHKAWYATQSAASYNAPEGYPWTRLGYTYNWNAKSNEVGLNEFVIKKGSTIKTVSVADTQSYCSL